MMIRAISIDDEDHCLDRLSHLLTKHCASTVALVGSARSVADGIAAIKNIVPDLVFLDVQIRDETGFDLLKSIASIPFDVIFTTAFEQYAVQAFKFSAVDYLLKPIDADDLKQAVGKLTRQSLPPATPEKFDVLFHNLATSQNAAKRITVPTATGLVFLQISDIIRCQSDGNYTLVFLKNGEKRLVSRTLKEFDDTLANADFFRVHHSHLINLAYIKSYTKGKGGTVVMLDNTEVEVSTRRKDDFLKRVSTGLHS